LVQIAQVSKPDLVLELEIENLREEAQPGEYDAFISKSEHPPLNYSRDHRNLQHASG